jgi:phage shock protein C
MSQEAKRLYRTRKNKIFFGVCSGLGDYFNADPVLIRLIFIALFFCLGATLIFYILMCLIVPYET